MRLFPRTKSSVNQGVGVYVYLVFSKNINLFVCINSYTNFLLYMVRGKKFREAFYQTYFSCCQEEPCNFSRNDTRTSHISMQTITPRQRKWLQAKKNIDVYSSFFKKKIYLYALILKIFFSCTYMVLGKNFAKHFIKPTFHVFKKNLVISQEMIPTLHT